MPLAVFFFEITIQTFAIFYQKGSLALVNLLIYPALSFFTLYSTFEGIGSITGNGDNAKAPMLILPFKTIV